jgi:hypothetical protein
MVHLSHSNKQSVRYRQFQGGYAKVPARQLGAMPQGYRLGLFRRNDVRVFAALWEAAALHQDSQVSLYRIVNCQSKKKGNRRLSQSAIGAAATKLKRLPPELESRTLLGPNDKPIPATTKPIARRVLRHVARGGATTVEALFYLAYFMCRIPQRKPMQRLKPQEHFARFRYAHFENWTGVLRTSQSRLFERILDRGFLNTAEVHKQNENFYGQLYIDGPMLPLVRRKQSSRRRRCGRPKTIAYGCEKMTTPSRVLDNTPQHFRASLINGNPKTEITRPETVLKLRESVFTGHADPDLRRIALRAAQMSEQCLHQAA